jgi:hypothetical protein
MRPMFLALMAAASLPIVLQAQARPMARRQRIALREAASSYIQPGEFYLVAANVRPYTVIGAYPSRAAADSAATRAGATYRTFGPYHGPRTADPWEVLSITVRVRTDSGERELHYNPRTVDAVFLSMSAVRKFLVPYYRELYGPAVGNSVPALILSPRPPTPPCHMMSVPCTVDSLLPLPVRGLPRTVRGRP